MGYNMTQTDCEFFIAKENQHEALHRVRYALSDDTLIRYTYEAAMEAEDLAIFLEDIAWMPVFDFDGNISSIHFEAEKMMNETEIFEAMAPFVKPGSYIEMCGEEGDVWRWIFDGESVSMKHPTMVWD